MASPAANFTADNFRRVKVLYDYDYIDEAVNKKVRMVEDEVFYLLNSDSQDWWEVCRPDSPKNTFYVPSTYVEVLSNISGSSCSQPEKVDSVNIQTHSLLQNAVESVKSLSTFKGSAESDNKNRYSYDEDTVYMNTADSEFTVKLIHPHKRPTDLPMEDDYVNLEDFRKDSGLASLNSLDSNTPPSPKTPEGESEYANLQDLGLQPPNDALQDATTPDLDQSQYQKTLQDTWDVYLDPISNRLFYVNKDTKETSWRPPRGKFHKELHQLRSGGNSPTKSPTSDSEQQKPDFSQGQGSKVTERSSKEPIEGYLNKCRMMNGKKSSKKWAFAYVKLGPSNLMFYKDQKAAQPKQGLPHGKCDQLVSLATCSIDKDTDKFTSKKNTIVLTCQDSQILLQADDDVKMQEWFVKIHTRIKELGGTPDSGQTLMPEKIVERKPSFKERTHMRKPSETIIEKKGVIKNVLERFITKRSNIDTLVKKGIYKDAVFGSDIKSLCAKEKSKVPKFVSSVLAAIEKRGLEHEGIYRIGGNISQIQKLRCMVDQGEAYNLDDQMWDVFVLTGTLKLFFRELKDPLFTCALFEKFLKSFLTEKVSDRLKNMKATVEELPKPHFDTLKMLGQHLLKVMDLEKENKMGAHQLAIVFGPTLIWPEVQHQNLATSMVYQSRIVEYILMEFNNIFK